MHIERVDSVFLLTYFMEMNVNIAAAKNCGVVKMLQIQFRNLLMSASIRQDIHLFNSINPQYIKLVKAYQPYSKEC